MRSVIHLVAAIFSAAVALTLSHNTDALALLNAACAGGNLVVAYMTAED
jgi:hypothetical protein